MNFKRTILYALYYSKLYKLRSLLRNKYNEFDDVLILTYHRILPKNLIEKSVSQKSMILSLETFKEQLKILNKYYKPVSINEYLKMNKSKHEKLAIITFDDGWADNYEYALEELWKNKIPATVYLTSDYIGTEKLFWPEEISIMMCQNIKLRIEENKISIIKLTSENIYEIIKCISKEKNKNYKKHFINILILHLKKYKYKTIKKLMKLLSGDIALENYVEINADRLMTWKEVNVMKKYNINIGSHSKSHLILTQINYREAIKEIIESKQMIEEKCSVKVKDFSFPNGEFNEILKYMLQISGYKSAVTGINSLSSTCTDKYELRRKGNNEKRVTKANGEFDRILNIIEWSDFPGIIRRLSPSKYH